VLGSRDRDREGSSVMVVGMTVEKTDDAVGGGGVVVAVVCSYCSYGSQENPVCGYEQ